MKSSEVEKKFRDAGMFSNRAISNRGDNLRRTDVTKFVPGELYPTLLLLPLYGNMGEVRRLTNIVMYNWQAWPDDGHQLMVGGASHGEELGFGGYSHVVSYRHPNVDGSLDQWAVKMAKRSSKNPYIKHEMKLLLEQLSVVPGVPRVLANQTLDDGHNAWFAMHPIKGLSLNASVKFHPEFVRQVAMKIANTLRHAHNLDIAHGDIKPGNVIASEDADVFTADWGIAKVPNEDTTIFNQYSTFGTTCYLPPEARMRKNICCNSDIYALACIMYEMLTGRQLSKASECTSSATRKHFEGTNSNTYTEDMLQSVEHEGFRLLLEAMLKINPADRPSALQVLLELSKISCDTTIAVSEALEKPVVTTEVEPAREEDMHNDPLHATYVQGIRTQYCNGKTDRHNISPKHRKFNPVITIPRQERLTPPSSAAIELPSNFNFQTST